MPFREIESIDSQPAREIQARVTFEDDHQEVQSLGTEPAGPWVLVKFVGDLHPHAIWKENGDVYQVGLDGAVGEDPIIRGR